jgi:hypothetical protein
MGTALGPGHLLLLTEALADHLIDRRFDKPGADPLPVAIALAVIGVTGVIAVMPSMT